MIAKQLSIIIINWNTRDLLFDCLQSLTGNLPADTEVIVVDNGSEDDSVTMLETSFPDVHLIANENNLGFAAANNQAMKIASGKYVLLLNSDTIIHGDVLQSCCQFMNEHSQVAVMGCKVLSEDGSLQISCSNYPDLLNLFLLLLGVTHFKALKVFDRYQMRHWDRRETREVDVISGCFMFTRREAIKEVGLLDDSFFFFAEEVDWCKRFRDAGWQVCFAPVGIITHLGGGSSGRLSFKRDLMLTNGHIRLHRKYRGLIGAISCWVILFGFNLSRAIFWNLRRMGSSHIATHNRADHFTAIIRHFNLAWPK